MELTHELLLKNGWSQGKDEYKSHFMFYDPKKSSKIITIICVEGFTSWLYAGAPIGEGFNTTEELQAIAKALFKIDLKFE